MPSAQPYAEILQGDRRLHLASTLLLHTAVLLPASDPQFRSVTYVYIARIPISQGIWQAVGRSEWLTNPTEGAGYHLNWDDRCCFTKNALGAIVPHPLMILRWKQNGLYFAAERTQDNRWLVWCCFQPLENCNLIYEPADKEIWFEYGATREEAIDLLLKEIGS